MKRIIQIVLLLLLISGTVYGQEKSDCPMDIHIYKRDLNQYIKLTITSPDGKDVWSIDSKCNIELHPVDNDSFVEVKNWYSISGSYKLTLEETDQTSGISSKESLEFNMNGNELNTRARFRYSNLNKNSRLFLRTFYIYKFYNSSDSIGIKEIWTPTSKGDPQYTLNNNSTVNVFGILPGGNFWGYVDKYNSGMWTRYDRAKYCVTFTISEPVLPGDSLVVEEGYFIGTPKEFTPGRYKYYTYYSHGKIDDIFADFTNMQKEETLKGVYNIYLLEKEFTIE